MSPHDLFPGAEGAPKELFEAMARLLWYVPVGASLIRPSYFPHTPETVFGTRGFPMVLHGFTVWCGLIFLKICAVVARLLGYSRFGVSLILPSYPGAISGWGNSRAFLFLSFYAYY